MNNVIYLSNKSIYIISYASAAGKVKVQGTFSKALPARAVFNGVIMDNAVVTAFLEDLCKTKSGLFQNVSVCTETSAILAKKLAVPDLKKSQYAQIAEQEIKEGGGEQEMVFDYSVRSDRNNKKYMMLCAVPRNVVEDYLAIFKAAGVQVDHMYVGLEMVVNYVRTRKELCQGVIAFNVLEDISMLSIIFEDGDYVFSTRTRIVPDEENDYAASVLQSISALTKFNQSVRKSYYVGAPDGLVGKMRELQPSSEVEFYTHELYEKGGEKRFPGEVSPFAYFSLFHKEDSIDFLQAAREVQKKKKPRSGKALAAILIAVGVAAAFVGIKAQTAQIEKNTDEINAAISAPENAQKMEEISALDQATGKLNAVNTEMDTAIQELTQYKDFNRDMLDWLQKNAGPSVRITSILFDAPSHMLQLTGVSSTRSDSSDFVERIQGYGEFADIVYTGYNTDTDGNFVFSLDITLKSGQV